MAYRSPHRRNGREADIDHGIAFTNHYLFVIFGFEQSACAVKKVFKFSSRRKTYLVFQCIILHRRDTQKRCGVRLCEESGAAATGDSL